MATVKLNVNLTGLPSHDLATIDGWDELEVSDQKTVKDEVTNLDKALITAGTARLAIGEHLNNIRTVLEPKRMFTRFLGCCTKFSRATAYRYIDLYKAAANVLPEPIMKQAMLRGMDRINMKAVEAIRAPKTTNVTRIDEYLTALDRHKEPSGHDPTPDDLKRRLYTAIHSAVQYLPSSPAARIRWLREVVGIGLTELGISDNQTFKPVPIPTAFVTIKGRPRQEAA